MARGHIYLDSGSEREGKTRYRTTGVVPSYGTLEVYPGEDIGSVAERAYGANTPENRERLTMANAQLKGTINVPR